MTIKEFLTENQIQQIQYVNDVLFNLISNEVNYGVDSDTSSIEGGTPLITTDEFVIEDDKLIFNDVEVDINKTNML